MTDDIDPLSATFHEHGEDALGVAVDIVATMLQVRDAVLTSRATEPETFPGFGSAEPEVVARRIVGQLLDAGGRPPSDEAVAAAAARAAEKTTQFRAWLDGLDDVEKLQAMSYYAEHNEFPPGLSSHE